jgi:hypothetical protein
MEDDIRPLSDELEVLALDLKAWFQSVLTLRERNVPPSEEIARRALALHEFFDTLRSRIADLAFATEPDFATPVLDLDNPAALKECLLEIAAARTREASEGVPRATCWAEFWESPIWSTPTGRPWIRFERRRWLFKRLSNSGPPLSFAARSGRWRTAHTLSPC